MAVIKLVARDRLGDVVQQRAPADGHRHIGVGIEFLGERRSHRRRGRTEGKFRMLNQIDRGIENLQRVVQYIEMVIAVLLHAFECLDLGQDHCEQAKIVETTEPIDRITRKQNALEFGALALARGLGCVHCIAASQRDRVWVDLEVQFGRESHEPQQPQRIVAKRLVGDRTQDARLNIVERTRHRHHVAAGEVHRDGVDGQIAAQQVGGDPVGSAGDIDLVILTHHAPRAMAFRQRKHGRADGLGVRASGGLSIARGDEIPIGQWPPEQYVTHSAANQPEVIAGHGRAYGLDRTRQPGIQRVTHPTTSRSPRSSVARTPQMIS